MDHLSHAIHTSGQEAVHSPQDKEHSRPKTFFQL